MKFYRNPFEEEFLKFERLGNEELRYAERVNVTNLLMKFLRDKLNRKKPENISMIVYGHTRSGKSYAAIAIAHMITQYLNKLYGDEVDYKQKVPVICRDESEFLEHLKDAEFQDVFVIDEKKETMVQEGSWSESSQMRDVDNICAVKCLTVIRLKPQEIYSTAQVTLKTHGRDFENFQTKLLCKVTEMNGQRWIGHVVVNLFDMLCEDRKNNVVGNCSVCPKFNPEREEDTCHHFIGDYERAKLSAVDSILQGSSEYRVQILMKLAKEIAAKPVFTQLKNAKARELYVRSIVNDESELENYTNRQLTISEIQQITGFAYSLSQISEFED